MGWFDDLGDDIENVWKDGEKAVGGAIDDAAHSVGDVLNSVGLQSVGKWLDHVGDIVADRLGATPEEMNLGETDNPADLVHGDPGAIDGVIDKLKAFATAFTETSTALQRIDTTSWTGAAADAFHAKYHQHPAKWANAADAMTDAATALSNYVSTLRWAQSQAGLAIHQYDDMKAAADRKSTESVVTEMAATASGTLSNARTQRNSAAATAAAAIDQATELAPAKPSFTHRMLDDAGDYAEFSALFVGHVVGGLASGLGDVVKLARSVNPTEPYNLTHPSEWMQSVSGLAAGLTDVGTHPLHLVHGLIGNGWGSDPGDAAGNLVAQILPAAFTGGGSEAADAAAVAAETATETAATDTATDVGTALSHDPAAMEPPAPHPDSGPEPQPPEPAADSRHPGSDQTGDQHCTDGTDPVDLATGEVLLPVTDLVLPGVLEVRLSRMFLSSFAAGRSFGRRWASSMDARIEVTEHGILLVGDDASIVSYPPCAAGETVSAYRGPRGSLTRLDTGGFRVDDPVTGAARFYGRDRDTVVAAGLYPLTALLDRHRNRIMYRHNRSGVVTDIVHSGGYHVAVDSDTQGRVTGYRLRDPQHPAGWVPVRDFGYDEAGGLTSVVNGSGLAERLVYDDEDRLTAWIDRNGYEYRYAYDDRGRCIAQAGADGSMASNFAYRDDPENPGGSITVHTTSEGAATYYRVDSHARITAVTDPGGATTATVYDGDSRRPAAIADALGRTVEYAYNADGDPIAIRRADGSHMSITYAAPGRPARVQDYDGHEWAYTYTDSGDLAVVTDPTGTSLTYQYDDHGARTAVIDQVGARTHIEPTPTGLPGVVRDASGAAIRIGYDAFGRITSLTDPLGNATTTDWSTDWKPLQRHYPDHTTETWEYDSEGNLLAHTDPAGHITRYTYGAFDQVATRTDPDGTRTRFAYDTTLNLIQVTNPQRLTWSYTYDPTGRLIAETDFDDRTLTYRYDPAGQLESATNGAGETTGYTYNLLGLRTAATHSGGVTRYSYDPADRIVRAENPDAVVEFERDPLGRVTAETVNGHRIRSHYDPAGRRIARTTPTGVTTQWHYDDLGRTISTDTGGHRIASGYDSLGRETTRRLGGGLALDLTWTPKGQLASQILHIGSLRASSLNLGEPQTPAITLLDRTYTYNPAGTLTAISEPHTGTRHYQLDPLSRVTAITGRDWHETYSYDPAGNLITTASAASESAGPDPSFTYSGTQLTATRRAKYRYDRQNRLTQQTVTRLSRKPDVWHYEWTPDDRLAAVTTPDATRWSYRYDPFGRRISKHRHHPDGTIAEHTRFTWDGDRLAEQTTTDGAITTWTYAGNSFTPLSQHHGTDSDQPEVDRRFYAIITDLVGTPTELIDPHTKTIAGSAATTLWGRTSWSNTRTPLRFPGQYFDVETGLHYNRHRYYNPGTGRYVTTDPLGLRAAPNPSTYPDNPTEWTDPLGLTPCSPKDLGGYPDRGDKFDPHGNRLKGGLPRDQYGNPVPDTDAPHSQLGIAHGRNGDYGVAREWMDGKPTRDVHFTDHGRPGNHDNPHQHDWVPNPSGGTPQHGPAVSLRYPQ